MVVPKTTFSSSPTDLEIQSARFFHEPLIPMSSQSNTVENAALSATLIAFKQKRNLEDFSDLTNFLATYPESKWRASLELSMGGLRKETGYISNALSYYLAAWQHSKNELGIEQSRVANRAIAEYISLAGKLGRVDEIEHALSQINERQFKGSEEALIANAKESLWGLKNRPDISYKCGPYALNSILLATKKTVGRHPSVEKLQSSVNGTNLWQLKTLSNQVGLNYQTAKRSPGAAIIVPSVIHFKVNHFGAITSKLKDKFQVKDPTFDYGANVWVSAKALEAESDGYFLVPAGNLPAGWKSVSQTEAEKIWGKGGSKKRAKGSSNSPSQCTAKKCSNGSCMAQAYSYTMQATLNIKDIPVKYSAPIGPDMQFLLNYNHLEEGLPANPNFTNVGPDWTLNWISYITVDASQNIEVMLRDGGSENYPFEPTNNINNPYAPDIMSQAVMTIGTAGSEYKRTLPDGSVEVFSQPDGTGRFFLTKVIDPQNNSTIIQYDANFRLTTITDSISQVTTLTYVSNTLGNPGFYKISQISDPFGRAASITYDTATVTNLLSITDAVGMVSSFTYDSGSSFINSMTTPYGTTSFVFSSVINPEALINGRGLRAQLPDGSASYVENYIEFDDWSYYWDHEQLALYPNDPANHDYTHCTKYHFAHDGSTETEMPILVWLKKPLENQVEYLYEGGHFGVFDLYFVGINNKPVSIKRATDGGDQLYQYQYGPRGNTIQSIDPIGRTFQYKYDANNIDLLEVRQTKGGANDFIGKWIYNDKHRPTQHFNGSGQKTSYVYNSFGQLTSTTDAAGNTTTLTYDGNKRLQGIDGPMPGSLDKTVFTWYDYGEVKTVTNSSGYKISYNYDNMNRLTVKSFPDESTEKTVYEKLDAVLTKDRNNRWFSKTYNSIDQLTSEIDSLGRKIDYTWCDCGSLATLKDGNGNMTVWHHDLQGRVTQKVFPDETKTNYSYEVSSSRLRSRTDALSQVATYAYNLDNTLSSIEYTNEVSPTSDVFLTYDQNYMRVASERNDWGTNTYFYHPYISDPLKAANFWLGGKPTVGDIINVLVLNSSIPSGKRNIQYVVASGDVSLDLLSAHISNAINADSVLNTANIKAVHTSSLISISAPPTIGTVTVKTSTNAVVTQTIGGTVTTGNSVNITVKDLALPGGQKIKNYVVAGGDSLTSIATGLKNVINADTDLQSAGITATSSAAMISITSLSSNGTTFSESVNAGGTATITHRGGPGETATAGGGGRLQSASNDVIANSTISYSYDVLGRTLNRAIDGASNSIYWNYDEMSRVTTEANLLGTFQYNYVDNPSGFSKGVTRLAAVNYPNNQITNFDWYNDKGDERLKQIQNLGPNGNVLSQFNYRYNPAGEITQWPQIQSGLSRFQQLGYDLAGQLTSSQVSNTKPSNTYLNQDYYSYDPGANRTGNQTNQTQNITVSGTKTTGDVITITVKDTGLSGGQEAVSYVVQASDSLTSIAANLAAAITLNANLQSLGINAVSTTSTLTVKSVSPNITTYTQSTNVGATEIIAVGTSQNFVENATITLRPGQSITTGDMLKLTVRDLGLPGGCKDVIYTVVSGNTLKDIATGLKAAINADPNLATLGVTATSAEATITIKSISANPTVYSASSVGSFGDSKVYIDLNICPNGTETLGISGTKTTGDIITLVVQDAGLPLTFTRTINYTTLSGDSLTSIATAMANAISVDAELVKIGVSATASGTVVNINSNSQNVTTYRTSTNANATEIVKLGLPPNGTQTAIIGGTKTTGNILTLTVFDAGLSGGSKAINYTLLSADTLTTATSALANAVNVDAALQALGITAAAVSTVLNIKSISQNATTYTATVSGGSTATLTLAKSIGAQMSSYNNVNKLLSIVAGGPTRFQAKTNKAIKSALINTHAASLETTKDFVRDESIATGQSSSTVAATDGANNTKTNTYQVNANNNSAVNFSYDANGNMTSDGTITYKWDAENRLIEIDYPGSGNKSEFSYDAMGQNSKIVERTGGNVTETHQFILENGQKLESRDETGNIQRRYLPKGEIILGSNFYYTTDHLLTTREMTTLAGQVDSRYSFDTYGRSNSSMDFQTADFQYASYFKHKRSNLNAAAYRFYHPTIGRWLNRDPIRESGGLNLYAYCGNDPLSQIDPLGLSGTLCICSKDSGNSCAECGFGHSWIIFTMNPPSGGGNKDITSRFGFWGKSTKHGVQVDDPEESPNPDPEHCSCQKISDGQQMKLMRAIQHYAQNEKYDPFTNNCSDFASYTWNEATGGDLTSNSSPAVLQQSIQNLNANNAAAGH